MAKRPAPQDDRQHHPANQDAKMPYNEQFPNKNDPMKRLLHEDDRDPLNPNRRL